MPSTRRSTAAAVAAASGSSSSANTAAAGSSTKKPVKKKQVKETEEEVKSRVLRNQPKVVLERLNRDQLPNVEQEQSVTRTTRSQATTMNNNSKGTRSTGKTPETRNVVAPRRSTRLSGNQGSSPGESQNRKQQEPVTNQEVRVPSTRSKGPQKPNSTEQGESNVPSSSRNQEPEQRDPTPPTAQSSKEQTEQSEVPSTRPDRRRRRQKKKRLKPNSPEPQEPTTHREATPPSTRAASPDTNNPLLPSASLFPSPSDNPNTYKRILEGLIPELRGIFSSIFDSAQDSEEDLLPCYNSIERVYEYFDKRIVRTNPEAWVQNAQRFGDKYRRLIVKILYEFGPIVWKSNTTNSCLKNCSNLLFYVFKNLGYTTPRGTGTTNTLKYEEYAPACNRVIEFFKKYIGDPNVYVRYNQYALLSHLLENSSPEYIHTVFELIGELLSTRAADKYAPNRAIVLKIMGYFVNLDNEDAAAFAAHTLKKYTRYDPNPEVRKTGTTILANKTRTKNRFFYDQAFDANEGVRIEAYKAMCVVDEQGNLVRQINEISNDKITRTAVWGTKYCGDKCFNIVKYELLPKWLKHSCNNNLVDFITMMDGYENMKGVNRILDLLINTPEQRDLLESLDLTFIQTLRANTLSRDYENFTIETYLGWLAIAKTTKLNPSLIPKVIPDSDEMITLIESLTQCTYDEHERAKSTGKDEAITPVVCLCIALEIAKSYVIFEEAGKRDFVKALTNILTDPLLDEPPLINQAIMCLKHVTDPIMFDDILMNVLQDVFDARSGIHNATTRDNGTQRSRSPPAMAEQVELEHEVEGTTNPPTPPPPPEPVYRKLTAYELTKLRDELCALKLKRLELQRQKQTFVNEHKYADALPLQTQIEALQTQEIELKTKIDLEMSDEIVIAPPVPPPGPIVRSTVASPARSGSETSVLEPQEPEVITTIEEGLAKGIYMINMYLDAHEKIAPFIRNLYENYAHKFLEDTTLRSQVLGMVCRLALIEPRELKRVSVILLRGITLERDFKYKHVAFQCFVDLLIKYDYDQFLMNEQEINSPEFQLYLQEMKSYVNESTDSNSEFPVVPVCVVQQTFTNILTVKYKSSLSKLQSEEKSRYSHAYYSGIIRLFLRGRIRCPSILSEIFCLWVDKSYSGTIVLRDLEHVLKLYHTFTWWGNEPTGINSIEGETSINVDDTHEDEKLNIPMMRVIGQAIAQAIVKMANDSITDQQLFKFIPYFMSFIDVNDQPLIRSMIETILNSVIDNVVLSQNALLIKAITKIPISNHASASRIMSLVSRVFVLLKSTIMTQSIREIKRELVALVNKYVRIFGQDIAVIQENGKSRRVDDVQLSDDEEEFEDEEEEELQQDQVFSSDSSVHDDHDDQSNKPNGEE